MARPKPKVKPGAKIGGGAHYDGMNYSTGYGAPETGGPDMVTQFALRGLTGSEKLTKTQYEAELAKYDSYQEKAKTFDKALAAAQANPANKTRWRTVDDAKVVAELKAKGYDASISPGTQDEYGNSVGGGVILAPIYKPTAEKSGMIAQVAVPEYTLDNKLNAQGEIIDARRDGYSNRIIRHMRGATSTANKGVALSNQAKQESVALAKELNQRIGAPSSENIGETNYRNWTGANQMIAIAKHNAGLESKGGVKRARIWAARAQAEADAIGAHAKTRNTQIQGVADASQAKMQSSNRLAAITQHLVARDQATAASAAKQQWTQGLINSSGPAAQTQSPLDDNSIEAMLRPSGQIA